MRPGLPLGITLALALLSVAPSARADTPNPGTRLELQQPALGAPRASLKLFEAPLELDEHQLLKLLFAADAGGGSRPALSGEQRPVLGFLIGFLVGFGIGHLVVGNQQGFVLFLIVDVVFVVALVLFYELLPNVVAVLATLGFVVERLFQGYDAYLAGGGQALVERSVESTLRIARDDAPAPQLPTFAPVARTLSLSF